MIYFLKLDIFIEVVLRLSLWVLIKLLDGTEPFVRQINPNEVWLYQFPITESYVPSWDLWIIIGLFPMLFLATEYFIGKNSNDVFNAGMGLTLSYGLNGFLTSILKIMVGRPRPDFYYRCFPEGHGTDFTKCTGPIGVVAEGRKSFPSGHSSFAFTCMVFMTLYIARKIDFKQDSVGGRAWKLCVCTLPLLVATAIAISRTCDYHHHYQDVIAGSLLGAGISYTTYQLYFPKEASEG